MIQMIKKTKLYRGTAVIAAIFALFAVFTTVQLLSADETDIAGNVDGSIKTVDQTTPEAGDTVRYTIMVSNTISGSLVNVTDTLPVGVTYAGNFTEIPDLGGTTTISGNSVYWDGAISGDTEVALSFDAVLTDTLMADDVLTNHAQIDNGTAVITRSVALTVAATLPSAPDLSTSYKMADTSISYPGDIIEYTVVVSNTGTGAPAQAIVTDTLPADLTYITNTLTSTTSFTYAINGQIVSWQADVDAGTKAVFYFQAQMDSGVSLGDVITNTVEIDDGTAVITRTAAVTIDDFEIYFPIIFKPYPIPDTPSLSATRPSSGNTWSLNWTISDDSYITSYTIQESSTPDFISIDDEASLTSLTNSYTHDLNSQPIYYYRVRAVNIDSMVGEWSNVVRVVGGYYDDFSDSTSGWTASGATTRLRRSTYIEKTDVKYGTGSEAGNLLILTFDLWDWAIASPLVPAPEVPYDITYRARVHDGSNLVSGGMVFGGDWNGDACPESGNVVQTDNCFNHFYNFNYIWHAGGALKLLHERVDKLVYCPNCGGSPLKRLGHMDDYGDVLDADHGERWNTYRVEVRSNGAKLYINGGSVKHFSNTTWINEPYFGVFSSTFEYEPSIWFFDYFEVKPVD